ncbi:hypothetical protein LQF60_09625 [Tetragenococcus koreensis]|uniref:hypothetical protein n=1 Tax=Tetragenococcus koreensis TaxID=290335 RepID=UPI001F30D172|nr:hypothetical protein [Tetragenococcus koreensis]MCF1585829.1 hypothetical protein [Tetragenococcus koreensis]MCF1630077.1 hypothetical protein [Tetragenococcus koreensis]
MDKPFLKHASVLIAAVLALGICVGGYYVSNQKQYQQRVAYANAAQSNEKAELNDLEKQVNELYTDDEKELLKAETTLAEVDKLRTDLDRVKVTAEDFQIKEESLPADMQDLAKEKEVVADSLADVTDKLQVQNEVDSLFTEEVPSWQKFEDSAVVKDDLKNEEVSDITEELGFFAEDQWMDIVQSYLSSASDQVQAINEIQEKLATYKEEEFSYDQYATLSEQIEQVRNQKQHDKFEEAADELGERFGVSTEGAAAESAEANVNVEDETIYVEQGVPTEPEDTEAY